MSTTPAEKVAAAVQGGTGAVYPSPLALLLECLDEGRTGRLMVSDAGLGVVEIHVMAGEVLAAHAADDDVRLLVCLSASGLLPAEQLDALAEATTAAGEFIDALYGALDEGLVQDLLFERFRENLFAFLGATRGIEFEQTDAVFVSNIQIGHDSRFMIEELGALRDRTAPVLSSRLTLLPGTGTGGNPDQLRVLELCKNGVTVQELLRRSGREPNRVLQAVADLRDLGVLTWDTEGPASAETLPPMRSPLAGPLELPLDDDHTDELQSERDAAAEASPGSTPDEESAYLDAFGDYDTQRGDGSFSGVRDRVDLEGGQTEELPEAAIGRPSKIVDMPEADAAAVAGAVSMNFAGPRLADDDARSKLEVVNGVLEAVRSAIDYINGGSGQARVQLLVDGSSGPFAALFSGVELRTDGRLPVDQVLKNLRKRPATEHRRLLQRASTDLIERALSLASEDLDDGLMEQVLEKVAGYQQRLGI